ncbi:MAG: tRNA 2-selenouridine(34) synthase MnmH [Gallionellaceae bacterium]|nr:MAG: tRNA 2-selenouridine(34) synthase MnmH [Gallionellaceae bacterium]
MRKIQLANVSQLSDYDDIIDVRSPAEFAEDHIPGAISAPVLDNEERARIGTLYKQVSPFEAQRLGAALIARNIAGHLETLFHERPREWKPLIYCWRGGQRSGAMAHIFAQVGWRVGQLQGGYKTYRRHVIDELETLPARFQFRVMCGATGSGKSRLLHALRMQGAQVLDLEQLAQHRGSLLGNLPDQAQPAQKMFETRLWDALRRFDMQQPVFVEAESRKIGILSTPTTLLEAIRKAECIAIDASMQARVRLLMEDYAHFLHDTGSLKRALVPLLELHGHKIIEQWQEMAQQGEWAALVADLLSRHYDPAYQRSTGNNFPRLKEAQHVHLSTLDETGLLRAVQTLCPHAG